VAVTVTSVQYPGGEEMGPRAMDLLPYDADDEYGWYAAFDNSYEAMIADGFIDQETLDQATEEAKSWYQNPRAFHFWALVFAAGKV
jgi:hypothetical protein